MKRERDPARAYVFAALCTGCGLLSGRIGLPLAHVDATMDVEASLRRLNERCHGSGVRIPRMFQPVVDEPNWSDWRLLPVPACRSAYRGTRGVRTAGGIISVDLPSGTTLQEFRGQLGGALSHLRLQDVAARSDYMDERSDQLADYLVQPRYTLPSQSPRVYRGAELCRDIYVLDPTEMSWRLLWLAVAARLAAEAGSVPAW